MATGWDSGLCQDYSKGLARWFSSRLDATHTIRRWFGEQRTSMTAPAQALPANVLAYKLETHAKAFPENDLRRIMLAAAQSLRATSQPTDAQIREVFLANGFTVKEGQTDLKPYVFQAARALLALGTTSQPGGVTEGWSSAIGAAAAEANRDAHLRIAFPECPELQARETQVSIVKAIRSIKPIGGVK